MVNFWDKSGKRDAIAPEPPAKRAKNSPEISLQDLHLVLVNKTNFKDRTALLPLLPVFENPQDRITSHLVDIIGDLENYNLQQRGNSLELDDEPATIQLEFLSLFIEENRMEKDKLNEKTYSSLFIFKYAIQCEVVFLKEKPMGVIVYYQNTKNELYIEALSVNKNFVKHGIGSFLINHAVELAKANKNNSVKVNSLEPEISYWAKKFRAVEHGIDSLFDIDDFYLPAQQFATFLNSPKNTAPIIELLAFLKNVASTDLPKITENYCALAFANYLQGLLETGKIPEINAKYKKELKELIEFVEEEKDFPDNNFARTLQTILESFSIHLHQQAKRSRKLLSMVNSLTELLTKLANRDNDSNKDELADVDSNDEEPLTLCELKFL